MKPLNALLLALGSAWGCDYCRAGDSWGGSLALTSDYLVRGISRSNDHPALQADLHYSTDSGLVTGLFASSTRVDPDQPQDVELDPFLGFVWNSGTDWRGLVRATYYSYPWNQAGSAYNYAQLDATVIYRDSLELAVIYSPDAPRYVANRGFVGVVSSSVEVNLQHRVYEKLSGIAGVGYSNLGGPAPGGYEYWSVGAAYDLGSVALSVSYVATSKGANSLFYWAELAAHWDATILYRF